jgi:K+-sensing histidine kinase KdpD
MFKCLNNDEQKNSTKGIGIGLVVSEKIVKAMGGEIGIKTAKGVGT